MSNDLKAKMDTIGDIYLINRTYYKKQLDILLKNVNPKDSDGPTMMIKDEFINMFSNIYVKVFYIDAFSLDFICGNKIVKTMFNTTIFKNVSLTPEKGEYFKIVPSNDRRTINIYHLVSLLNNEVLLTIDFKQLNSIVISDNRIINSGIETDLYYGGLFKIKKSIDEEITPIKENNNQQNNGSLFGNKHVDSVSSTETKKLPEDNLLLTEYQSRNYGRFTFDQKPHPEFKQKCIEVIKLIYNVNVKEVKIEGSVSTRLSGYLFRLCILNDGEIDYIIVSTYDGEVVTTMIINTNTETIIKNTFDNFIYSKGIKYGR